MPIRQSALKLSALIELLPGDSLALKQLKPFFDADTFLPRGKIIFILSQS